MKINEWGQIWIETYVKQSVSKKVYDDYKSRLNRHIYPAIGNLDVNAINQIDIMRILNNLTNLTNGRIKKIFSTINGMYQTAVNNGYASKNPALGIIPPRGKPDGSRRNITDLERRYILKLANTHRYGMWVKLMLYCGLRTGETGRVKKRHIDLDNRLIYIDGTKTYNAKRYVPLTDQFSHELSQYIAPLDNNDYLFMSRKGNQLKSSTYVGRWASFKRDLSQIMPEPPEKDLVPYCLRHTFCTDLQDAGVPINIAKDLMGHSDISLTAKIYTHQTARASKRARECLEKYRTLKCLHQSAI